MNNLLQGNEKRQLQLAETLITNGDWMTLNDLSQMLNQSERTIRYDIKNFKEAFPDFNIESSHRGIRLIFDHNKGLKNIYINLFDRSVTFKLLETIFFNETYTVPKLAEKFYISPSTLYRTIHQINRTFEKDNFHIETNPCRVVGNEERIRYFYYQFFYEKYTIMTWPYNRINLEMLNDLLYFFMDLTQFKADFAYYNIARLILFINLYRYKNEDYILSNKMKMDLTDILSKIKSSPKSIEYFEKRFKLKIDKTFIIQLSSPFIKDGFSFNYNEFELKIKQNNQMLSEVTFLREFLKELSETNSILLPNKEKVVFELNNASYLENYDPRSGYILYNRNQFFADAIKAEFPEFFDQMYQGIKEFRKIANLPITEKNINYLIYILFTEWDGLLFALEKQRKKVKVLLISNRNLAHSRMLEDFLQAKFSNHLVTEVYDDTIVSVSILENLKYDLIVANFPIPELRNKESIYIENFPTQNEIFQLQQKIDNILSEN